MLFSNPSKSSSTFVNPFPVRPLLSHDRTGVKSP
ncbi:hypothetical protein M3J09_003881 [Ascochyta lentis]